MVRLVIDTDPGVDDAHAIMMALAHPNVRVEALTTVNGNVGLDKTTANACKILDAMGSDAQVYAGCAQALVAQTHSADYVHGFDGLGDSGYPASPRKVETEHASSALVRLANENPGELTLVAIGPLTNLAVALRLDPTLPGKFKKLVVMGGAIRAQGNTTPTTEFNVFVDPEAAEIVFRDWPGLSLVSWETTMAHCFTEAQVAELNALETPRAEFFKRITNQTLDFIQKHLGTRALFAADFLAVAAAIEPEIVTSSVHKYMDVELASPRNRGQTVVDWSDLLKKEPNTHLVLEMDIARLWELMKMAVA